MSVRVWNIHKEVKKLLQGKDVVSDIFCGREDVVGIWKTFISKIETVRFS